MKCRCGGNLEVRRTSMAVQVQMAEFILPKPYHKKKRILKKRMEAWRRQVARLAMVGAVLARPSFSCDVCGRSTGFYQVIAQNIFTVDPMPEGARPFYILGPDDAHPTFVDAVASIVTDDQA